MLRTTSSRSSSSKQYFTSGVIASRTLASGPLPWATARTAMSRSVSMPTIRSPSPTGSTPTSSSAIRPAAFCSVSSGPATATWRVITSPTFMSALPARGSSDRNNERHGWPFRPCLPRGAMRPRGGRVRPSIRLQLSLMGEPILAERLIPLSPACYLVLERDRRDGAMTDFPGSLPEFERRFPDEAACAEWLLERRWGSGFACPGCGHDGYWRLGRKVLTLQCRACRRETSVTAGTVMHRSHLPLKVWFTAAWLVATHRNGMSARQLWLQLGLGSYESAWLLLRKLRAAMVDPDREPLAGLVEVDETSLPFRGGGEPARPGR